MTARLGDDGYQGYGSIDPMVAGGFTPRASVGRFGELQNKLSRSIFDIGRQTNTLRDLHRQASRGQGDVASLARQLEHKLADVQGLCKDAGQNMVTLAMTAKDSGEREKQLIANSLRADFERAFSNFNNVQTDVINLLKNLPPQRLGPDTETNPFGDSGEVVFDDDNEKARLIQREREQAQRRELQQRRQQELLLEEDTTMIQQRYEDLRKLEQDVVTLNQLMRDIMVLVIEQGEQIDTIEQHVEYTQQKTVAGRKNLQKAEQLQKSNRRLCLCIICICLSILIALGITSGIVAAIVKNN
ncbi:syntaxin-12-like [Dysidea avara]|uniref:syntaxin-12-like n=1 Tax=Dysidea avara TaxID=196820 RepID=UPI00331E346B